MPNVTIVCPACARDVAPGRLVCPHCSGPLDASVELPPLTNGIGALIDERAQGVWRYRAAMALGDNIPVVSLGEGSTPVVALTTWGTKHGLSDCRAKLEFMAPTGSFKDRGAATVIAALKAAGVTRIVEDSSGNAGAAMAAYAARAGLTADIYVPEGAPASKVSQISGYGATVHRIAGTRENVATAAAHAAEEPSTAHASHSHHAAFIEGTKTFMLELVEHSPDGLPDHMVFPVGNGGLILGAHKALTELRRAGLSIKMPRLHIAQADACAPLVQALNRGLHNPVPVQRRPTIAGGIDVATPYRGASVLAAARSTNGTAIAVSEDEIRLAHSAVAGDEGLFVETTSAAAFAAAARLRNEDVIGEHASVLILATGSGLKDCPV